jgi:hypothetical protein
VKTGPCRRVAIELYIRSFTPIPQAVPHGEQELTRSNDTFCAIAKRGSQINLEEPFPFLRVLSFIQADPVEPSRRWNPSKCLSPSDGLTRLTYTTASTPPETQSNIVGTVEKPL